MGGGLRNLTKEMTGQSAACLFLGRWRRPMGMLPRKRQKKFKENELACRVDRGRRKWGDGQHKPALTGMD